jgi:hypothetical protein
LDYVEVEGLKFPTNRIAYLRNPDDTPDYDFNAVWIELSNYQLRR